MQKSLTLKFVLFFIVDYLLLLKLQINKVDQNRLK